MKFIQIFLLHSQHVLQERARAFVWFLVPLIESGILLLFWIGAIHTNSIQGLSVSTITTYYLFQVILSVILTSHIEEDVAREDIREGKLSQYLIRPISYFWIKFFEEVPYRLLQGFYGLLAVFILSLFIGKFYESVSDPMSVFLSFVIATTAYFLFFTYKMIIGILAFWMVDIGGFFQFQEMILALFAGYMIPLFLFPPALQNFSYLLPFPYMIYFPIISFQGKLVFSELIHVFLMQLFWLGIFLGLYIFLWKKGIRKYSAIGQ
ncbi:MAG: ABC-2 family transporter protein [Candidatus Levybacteria bacterium]|nr:ABC-2 family transporter protein [Candidatus Levybacteria bacterium]